MQLLCFRRSGYSALGRGYPVTMEGGHRRLDLLGSAGSCPVSPVWLCSLEGGGIRGRLNLDNLFRDFQGLFFFLPNSSRCPWLPQFPPDLHSSFSLVSTALEVGEGKDSGELRRTRRIGRVGEKVVFSHAIRDLVSG